MKTTIILRAEQAYIIIDSLEQLARVFEALGFVEDALATRQESNKLKKMLGLVK